MSYYCLKKISTEIELLTTLGTENDLLHSKSFDRERKFDSYIYSSYINVNRVMGHIILDNQMFYLKKIVWSFTE